MSEILPPVYVLIDRPEGYEDVCADLVIEDALNSGWCRENVVHDATGEVAALRAENARLRDLLTSARYYVGHAGEMRDAIDAALATAAPAKEE